MKFDIKTRASFGAKVLFTADIPDDTPQELRVKAALQVAVNARANLAGAYLAGANLAGAYLAGAYLADANLAGASLADANLAGASLARANLARANLARANLAGASLAGASLARANLARANLADACLAGASLADASLADASLARAKNLPKPSPKEIARLDEVRESVLKNPDRLAMSSWHSGNWTPEHTPEEEHACGSAHCIAGWLQALCPDSKVRQMDPRTAGVQLAPASAYMFTASDERALRWLKDREYARFAQVE